MSRRRIWSSILAAVLTLTKARCRRCRWRSRWRATAAQVWAEHDRHQVAAHASGRGRRVGPASSPEAAGWETAVRPVPPGWGPVSRPGWGYLPPLYRRRPELGGVTVLVLVTVLALLAAPHAHKLRGMVEAGVLPAIRLPQPPHAPAAPERRPAPGAARAVAYALAQRGKPYRWAAEGPAAFDCSGLTWASWRAAGVAIPRTAAGQLAGLPRVRGPLRPGDLVIYRTDGPSGRHVAIVVGAGRMVEARGRGIPVRSTSLRGGYLGAVRPGAGR